MNILWIIVIGFVAGVIARFLAPGPNNPQGFILTTVIGIVGAFLATFIGQAVGWYRLDQGAGTIGAVVVLFVWHGWCHAGLSKTPAPAAGCSSRRGIRGSAPDRAALHDCAGRSPLHHNGAWRTDSAGNGDAIYVLALPYAQDDTTRFVGSNFHQRCNDFHLFLEIVCQTLRGDNRFFDCGRITPHPPPSVLGFPYVVHLAP